MAEKRSPHSMDPEEVIEDLGSDPENGLDPHEARNRSKRMGPNLLKEPEERSPVSIFVDQINNPVICLLVAAAFISFLMKDIPEGIAITIVILLNAGIGFWMEFQAKRSMDALKRMDRIFATVIRKGEIKRLDSIGLVPGDLLTLGAGNMVPADARILSVSDLQVDESPLTGESTPVRKDPGSVREGTSLAGRSCMLYKGTSITNGRCKAVVTATGMDTEIGDISRMVEEAKEERIPINRKLSRLTHRLIWAIGGLAIAYFVLGVVLGEGLYRVFQTSVAWAIAAIPEGLPIVASIALARGMLKLAERRVIVKRLSAVETLGETTVICTDKTGTLTENRLKVNSVSSSMGETKVRWQGSTPETDRGEDDQKEFMDILLKIGVLCNNARIEDEEKGDPIEIALLELARSLDRKMYLDLVDLDRMDELPFDPEKRIMGTVARTGEGTFVSVKGATGDVLKRSDRVLASGGIKDMDSGSRNEWIERTEELSSRGLRVLAFAFGKGEVKEKDPYDNLIFAGLIGFMDPPRKGISEAISNCTKAGIRIVMITGDHPSTSLSIAKRTGMVSGNAVVLTGSELEDIYANEEGFDRRIKGADIFARAEPGHKLNIVESHQRSDDIVGVTGDGVNDTPALKKADIGIAMGRRGTQAARQVADMVLKDDSLASIVGAVEQGRIIFGNIRKFISYQLSYHLGEIILIALISFVFLKIPILPLQLLYINLFSDVFPALALSLGKGDPQVMENPPRDPETPILTGSDWRQIGGYGMIISVFVIAGYVAASQYLGASVGLANNIAFFSLALTQFWHVFNMRDDREGIFNNQVTRNRYIWVALAICMAGLAGAYLIPGLNDVLSVQTIGPSTWAYIFGISLCPLITIQVLKSIRKREAY